MIPTHVAALSQFRPQVYDKVREYQETGKKRYP
jgi:hypothetical protein